MTVLVTTEAIVIALLAVLVAGLLRSHAEILRALHRLGAGVGDEAPLPPVVSPVAPPRLTSSSGTGTAFDLVGAGPDDGSMSISIVGARVDTLLAFLSSGCSTCAGFWEEFAAAELPGLPPRTRLVVVTRGAGEESPARIRRLAPPHVAVVMTDAAWEDYSVPGAPYFVHVDGSAGRVSGEGTAATWAEVASLLGDAVGDGQRQAADSENGRAARADAALMAAGIAPGDSQLYPAPIAADKV